RPLAGGARAPAVTRARGRWRPRGRRVFAGWSRRFCAVGAGAAVEQGAVGPVAVRRCGGGGTRHRAASRHSHGCKVRSGRGEMPYVKKQPTRGEFLRQLGMAGVTIATGARAPAPWRRPRSAGAPRPAQLHLQFGTDASREMVASWTTPVTVSRPRLRLGTPAGGMGTTVPAET